MLLPVLLWRLRKYNCFTLWIYCLLFRSSHFGEKASRVSPYKDCINENDVPTFNTETSNLEHSVAPRGHGFSHFGWPIKIWGWLHVITDSVVNVVNEYFLFIFNNFNSSVVDWYMKYLYVFIYFSFYEQ